METLEALGGPELVAVAAIWVAQKRELVVAFGGNSMSPAIAHGQKVLLRCGVRPQVGEVAAYVREDRIAVHRVVASDDRDWILTWGDANPLPDDPVDDSSRIVGTVSRIDRNGAMEGIPPPPRSLRRILILRFAVRRNAVPDAVRRRISLLYRVRANLVLTPSAIVRKIVRKLFSWRG
jgi:signal peptidase I